MPVKINQVLQNQNDPPTFIEKKKAKVVAWEKKEKGVLDPLLVLRPWVLPNVGRLFVLRSSQ
jgi:hypothetical protein